MISESELYEKYKVKCLKAGIQPLAYTDWLAKRRQAIGLLHG